MNDIAKWILIVITVAASAIYAWTDAQAHRTVRQSALVTGIVAVLAFAFFWLIWPYGLIPFPR